MADLATMIVTDNFDRNLIKAGITTFNVLSVRALKNVQIKDFLNLSAIFANAKTILFARSISIKDRRLLFATIQKFMSESLMST